MGDYHVPRRLYGPARSGTAGGDHSLCFERIGAANHEESSQAVSGALWIRLWISLVVIVTGLFLAMGLQHIFVIPPALQRAARLALLVTTVNVAVNLYCGVFAGVLVALHRYDLTSSISILQTCARAAGVLYLFRSGHGILSLAILELCLSVAAQSATIVLCFRIYPQLKIAFGWPDSATLRKLWNYSFYVFLINVALQVTYYTDNLVVGAFHSDCGYALCHWWTSSLLFPADRFFHDHNVHSLGQQL